ncbi:hypothetical protein J6590_001148 [Homalodisca vitripennis]|nr:hypothetical protein J6590_001148 [Homalodisca vitripennis]
MLRSSVCASPLICVAKQKQLLTACHSLLPRQLYKCSCRNHQELLFPWSWMTPLLGGEKFFIGNKSENGGIHPQGNSSFQHMVDFEIEDK